MQVKTVPINKAKDSILDLILETNKEHLPIILEDKNNSVVLLSLDDWNAIEETLYLSSIPGMKKSIIDGLNTPIQECEDKLEW